MFDLKKSLSPLLAAVFAVSLAGGAEALTLKLSDLTDDQTGWDLIIRDQDDGAEDGNVSFSGTLNGNVDLDIQATGILSSFDGYHEMNLGASLTGMGHVRVQLQHYGLSDFDAWGLSLQSAAATNGVSDSVRVRHEVGIGSTWTNVADIFEFGDNGFQSGSGSGFVNADGTFNLRTTFTILNNGDGSETNSDLTASVVETSLFSASRQAPDGDPVGAVPVPAAGLLLVGALGGLGFAARRRRKAG